MCLNMYVCKWLVIYWKDMFVGYFMWKKWRILGNSGGFNRIINVFVDLKYLFIYLM